MPAKKAAKTAPKADSLMDDLDREFPWLRVQRELFGRKDLAVDFGGHYHGYRKSTLKEYRRDMALGRRIEEVEVDRLVQSLKTGEPLDPPVRLNGSSLQTCTHCGQAPTYLFDGKTFRAEPCPFPQGQPPIVFEINCPSGKMVVANDLREVFKVQGDWYINYLSENVRWTLDHAKAGLALGSVGNTCPTVFQMNKAGTHFVIGRQVTYDKDYNDLPEPIKPSKRAVEVASVCTDLWAYSICDYDEFVRRAGEEPEDTVIKLKPGVYQFTHYYHTLKEQLRKPQVFARFRRIRKPDPVQDLGRDYREKNLTAGQVVAHHLEKWGSRLYGGSDPENVEGIRGVVDHLMCVIGNGAEQHPNGWVGYTSDIPDDYPEVDIPWFEGPFGWYPLCGYSALAEGAGLAETGTGLGVNTHYNPSFVLLSWKIVRSMLAFGVTTFGSGSGTKKEKQAEVNRQLHWAWHINLGLRRLYPDQIPDCCRDLPKPEVPDIDKPPK